MKDYFNFSLTGKKFFPIWILFLLCFAAPYMTLLLKMTSFRQGGTSPALIFPILILLFLVAFVFSFYMAKLMIENVIFKDMPVKFSGSFGEFLWKVILGLFLTIITIGIYMAWFIADLQRYFVNNSSYDSESLEFKGKGGKLFVILLLTLMLPMIVLIALMPMLIIGHPENAKMVGLLFQIVMVIVLVPYIYCFYKWMVNISYKGYIISWETKFWNSCAKIAMEIILSIVTVGIFAPLAMVRLYEYFADRTYAISGDAKLKFGYEIDQLNDFLFIWGQILLTIITLSVYYPWAYCKIRSRILSKTYLIHLT